MSKKTKTIGVFLVIFGFIYCIACMSGNSDSSTETTTTAVAYTTQTETQAPETTTETTTQQATTAVQKTVLAPVEAEKPLSPSNAAKGVNLSSIPAYSGKAYVAVNNNVPSFSAADLSTKSSESYSFLDSLGRCGVAFAVVGLDLMPTQERGSIGQVKPSGWHTVRYDIVDGSYLYNRCHLIGYQLSGENANERNLITGTRYMNVQGMLPFENMVADYVKETGNHVAYRVTPVYSGNNLLASGVQMEAKSVEDNGDGILFNVYCYNVQPGVNINYANGDSALNGTVSSAPKAAASTNTNTAAQQSTPASSGAKYILNTNSKKFHLPECSSVKQMSEKNKKEFTGSRDEVISMGYVPCKNCNP